MRIIYMLKTMEMEYKGYTIVEDFRNPYGKECEYMFYHSKEGIQHDADYDGESFKYCGNCQWASSLEDAMSEIDEMTYDYI